MRDSFKAVTEAVGKVVCRIYPPLVSRAMMFSMLFLRDAICEQIPHLGIAIVQVLLHPQGGLSGLVFAMAHGSELGKAFGRGPMPVGAGVPRLSLSFASATLSDDFGFYKRLACCAAGVSGAWTDLYSDRRMRDPSRQELRPRRTSGRSCRWSM